MTLYEKIKNCQDEHEMAVILDKMLEQKDYELCSESMRNSCNYDAHFCYECIHNKLSKDV